MVLLTVGGVSGILNLPIMIPRNAIVLLLSYDKSVQKYALQMQCIFAIVVVYNRKGESWNGSFCAGLFTKADN